MDPDIYALSDREVFRRVVPASIKKVCASLGLFGLTFLTARFLPSWTFDVCTFALFCFAIDIVIVAWGTILAIALFFVPKHRQTKYDIGASLVRFAEGCILIFLGYELYFRFLR
jgi:hypothetical protein